MFTVAASIDIVSEAIARYRDRYPAAEGRVIANMHDRILTNIDERVDDFTIDGSFPGTDEGDAHVDAAAEAGEADIVLTCDSGWKNLTDDQVDALPYEAHHPDSFFCLIDDSNSSLVRHVTTIQARYWYAKNTEVDLPTKLRKATCPQFADRVRNHLRTMDRDSLLNGG